MSGILMQLNGILSIDEDLEGPVIKKLFQRATNYALQTVTLEGDFPKVKYSDGVGRHESRFKAYASYRGSTNTMTYWVGSWKILDRDFKSLLKQIIEILLEEKNRDNLQQMSTPDITNTVKDEDIEKIKSLILDGAAIIISFTIAHELQHANQMYIYGSESWENVSNTAVYEYDAVDTEWRHESKMLPLMNKIAEELAHQVYLILLEFGVEQERMELLYERIIFWLQDEMNKVNEKIARDLDFYDSPKVPSKQEMDSNEKYFATYRVRRGDNLYKIAKKFNVDFKDILRINRDLKNPNKIYVGQMIRVPNSLVLPDELPRRRDVNSGSVAQNRKGPRPG